MAKNYSTVHPSPGRVFCVAAGEYVDRVSGAKESRPQLNQLMLRARAKVLGRFRLETGPVCEEQPQTPQFNGLPDVKQALPSIE